MIEKIKKNSTSIIIVSLIITYLLLVSIVGAGFSFNPNVKLADFSVSEDGTEIILKTSVNTPSESIRKFTYIPSGDAYFLDFLYSFGVGTFLFGEKDEFILEIDENCRGIFFQREDGYELVLYKNEETNQWEIPLPETTEK